jgi:hypothetical protein
MAEETTLTPNQYEKDAQEILVQIRALMQKVRGYGFVTKSHRKRLTPAAALKDPYLLSVAVAMDASADLAQATGITGAEIRDIVNFCNAFLPVVDEMRLAAAGLEQTIQTQRGEGGQKCLKAYSMAKSFNRPGADGALLVPHIADMKRTLGRGRKKPASLPAPTEPVAPQPAKKAGGANA